MGGDVKMSINEFSLPNVNNNTHADRRAERRQWAALPGWRMLGWGWRGCGEMRAFLPSMLEPLVKN